MAQSHGSAWCPRCKDQVLTISSAPAHLFHLAVALVGAFVYLPLLLLWLAVWSVAVVIPRTQRCSKCGGDIALLTRAAKAEAKAAAKAAAKDARAA